MNWTQRAPDPGPVLTFAERDRRWNGLRRLMREQSLEAIVVGSVRCV